MAKGYLAELELLWRQKRKAGRMPGRRAFDISNPPPKLRRSQALRGPDLVNELIRLAVWTGDGRFEGALDALIEHRIVDRNHNFLAWEPEAVAAVRERGEFVVARGCRTCRSFQNRAQNQGTYLSHFYRVVVPNVLAGFYGTIVPPNINVSHRATD